VLILAWSAAHDEVTVTSYGLTAEDKHLAAAAADHCLLHFGDGFSKPEPFEDFRTSYEPAYFKEAVDLVTEAYKVLDGLGGPVAAQLRDFLERLAQLKEAEAGRRPATEAPNAAR
jgi:hypothetical protein